MDMKVHVAAFCDELAYRVAAVTDEAVARLCGGCACPQGGMKTNLFLTWEQKAQLIVFQEEFGLYQTARKQYVLLTPLDIKAHSYLLLATLERRCQQIIDCFWLNVRLSLPPDSVSFREVGFDTDFRLWYGPAQRRDLGDLRMTFDVNSIRL